MIGIAAIGSYIPKRLILTHELQDQFGVDSDFIAQKTGMISLARKDPAEDTSTLCLKAFENLRNKLQALPPVDCLIVCTQNPDGYGLPNVSSKVHAELGLSTACASFDISLGCSGYVYGLSIIKAFMESNGLKNGLLFTADPYSKIVDAQDKNTALLFGDAASASLVTESPLWNIGQFSFGSMGSHREDIARTAQGLLKMNGRSVFSFSATHIPPQIEENLIKNSLSKEQVDLFLLHQGSRYIVETIRTRLGLNEHKVPFVAGSYGNTVSSSIPIALETCPESARHVVLSGFGVGLSWATVVVSKNGG